MPARTINNLGGSAGRKRSRRDQENDGSDQEIDEVRQASSGLQADAVRVYVAENETSPVFYLPSIGSSRVKSCSR